MAAQDRQRKCNEMTVPDMDTPDRGDLLLPGDDVVADHPECSGGLTGLVHLPTKALASRNESNDSTLQSAAVACDTGPLVGCGEGEDFSTKIMETDETQSQQQQQKQESNIRASGRSSVPGSETVASSHPDFQLQGEERKSSFQSDAGSDVFSAEQQHPFYIEDDDDTDDDSDDSDEECDFSAQSGNGFSDNDLEDEEQGREGEAEETSRPHPSVQHRPGSGRSSKTAGRYSSSRTEAGGSSPKPIPQTLSVPSNLQTTCRRHSHSGVLVFRCQVNDLPDPQVAYSSSPPYFSPKWTQVMQFWGHSDGPVASGRKRRNTVACKVDKEQTRKLQQLSQDCDPTSENFAPRGRSFSESDVQILLMKQVGSELRRISDEFNFDYIRRGKLTTVSESASEDDVNP